MSDETTELGSKLNPDDLPVGLTISDDGNLLNWRGENYVKQSTLGGGTLTAEQVEIAINDHCQFTVGCVVDAQAIADELNAKLEEKPRDRTEERLLNACNQATQDYVTQLERERDELKAFSRRLETAAHDKLGTTLFGVDYVTEDFMLHVRDTLTAERDEWKAKLADLSARAERTCHIIEYDEAPYPVCSECGAVQPDDYTVYFCWNCGAKVKSE